MKKPSALSWNVLVVCSFLATTACIPEDSSATATLYRNSSFAGGVRVHWATFDAKDSDPGYNMNNCQMASRLLNANLIASAKAEKKEPYLRVGFWCEEGTYREQGAIPTTFARQFPTEV